MTLLVRGLSAAQSLLYRFGRALPLSIRSHGLLLAILFVYWIGGLIIGRVANIPASATATTYLPTFMRLLPVMIAALVAGRGLQIIVFERPRRPLSKLLLEVRTTMATPE